MLACYIATFGSPYLYCLIPEEHLDSFMKDDEYIDLVNEKGVEIKKADISSKLSDRRESDARLRYLSRQYGFDGFEMRGKTNG